LSEGKNGGHGRFYQFFIILISMSQYKNGIFENLRELQLI